MHRSREALLFVLSGGVAALANMSARFIFSMALSYPTAIVLAYGVGMVIAFVLFKNGVFQRKHSHDTRREAFWFVVVNVFSLLQILAVSLLLADFVLPRLGFLWRVRDVAHVTAVGSTVFTSYFGHKYLTFKKRRTCV